MSHAPKKHYTFDLENARRAAIMVKHEVAALMFARAERDFRLALHREAKLRDAVESICEDLLEEYCDCPPEWPRCVVCRMRLRLRAALNDTEPPKEGV